MSVTFKHPLVPHSTNPFEDFNPANGTHYPTGAGVYIYGLRLEVDGEKKFVPLCVGETGDLSVRLQDHYTGFVGRAGVKALWDFSRETFTINDIILLYRDMLIYDPTTLLPNRTLQPYLHFLTYLKRLIYYQNINYFNHKLGFPHIVPHINLNYNHTIAELTAGVLLNPHSNNLANKITATLDKFRTNFYFVYADNFTTEEHPEFQPLTNINHRLNIEVKAKNALSDKLYIGTVADSRRNPEPFLITIDLSLIQDILVNVGHNYGNPYINPLIL